MSVNRTLAIGAAVQLDVAAKLLGMMCEVNYNTD